MSFITPKIRIFLFIIFNFFILKNSLALESLSYSGRLVQANGAPVTGSVNLKVELAYSGSPESVKCSQDFTAVPLTNGVFHLKVDFDCGATKTLSEVFAEIPANQAASIRVTDVSHSKVYSYQALHSVPFANISDYAKQLSLQGNAANQVLTWNNTDKKWEAGIVAGAFGGTVTNVSVSAPLTISNPASTPSITLPQATNAQSGYLSSADWTTFNNKEGTIAGGTAAQYYRGDKTWQTLDTSVVPENTNLYFSNARALGVPLTGFSISSGAIAATDSVLSAFEKTQGQINTLTSDSTHFLKKDSADTLSSNVTLSGSISSTLTGDIIVATTPLGVTSAVNKGYVDSGDALKVSKAGDTMSGVLTLDSDLKIKGGSNYVNVKGHASSANYNLFLPQTAGTAGYVLSTDGSGNTSWVSPTVNSSSIADGSIVDADINASAAIAQSKIAGLTTDLSNKEPTITAGTTAQYYRGDKTFVDLGTDVRNTALTGFTVGANSAIVATDTTVNAFKKVQGQIDATNTAVAGKEPSLTAGSTSQYYRGDKSWQTLNGSVVANTAAGTIAATNVQSALNELDSEKQANITSFSTITTGSVTTSLQNGVSVNPFGAAGGNTGELRFYELSASGSNYTSLKAPDGLAADINYVLPSVAPTAGQVLSSSAAGVMSWTTLPTAPVSTVFGRSGIVTATSGDYTASQITNTPAGTIAATNVQAALNELDTDKQSLITAGTTSQYYRGDKTFVDFGTDVRATTLSGYAVGTNTAIAAGDSTLGAFQKVQGQINATNTAVAGKEPAITAGTTAQYIRGDKTLSTFVTDVINSVLGTMTPSLARIATADSIQTAFNKTQGQLDAIAAGYVSKDGTNVLTGASSVQGITARLTVPTPLVTDVSDAANVQFVKDYVGGYGQWAKSGSNIYFNTGNVGIGTSSPSSYQHGGTNRVLEIHNPGTTQNSQNHIVVSTGATVADSSIGSLTGAVPNATATNKGVGIFGIATGPNSTAANPTGELRFWTRGAADTNWAERMRVSETGNVGIGTPTPGYGLTVSNAKTSNTGSMFVSAQLNGSGKGLVIDSTTRTTGDNSVLALEVINRAGTNTMAATVEGNVGVGTATPSAKLDVAGDIKATAGGTIGVTRVVGTWGSGASNITNGNWTYVGDNITLPAGSWIVYYSTFYDHDGTTQFNFGSYNHPFLSTNTSNSGAISQGDLSTCGQNYCPVKETFQVTVASTTTLYVVHLIANYTGAYVRIRQGWGNFYAIKVN